LWSVLRPGGGGFCAEFYAKNKEALNRYYSLDLMKGEAAKAKELGCEALYMDPGWDTGLSTQVWDAERLGPMDQYVKMLRDVYGLRGVSLWCSLAGVPPTIGDVSGVSARGAGHRKDGNPVPLLLCQASPAYIDTKEKRLLELCKNGAVFLMF